MHANARLPECNTMATNMQYAAAHKTCNTTDCNEAIKMATAEQHRDSHHAAVHRHAGPTHTFSRIHTYVTHTEHLSK